MIRCVVLRGSLTANLLIAGGRKYATAAAVHKSKSTSTPVFYDALGRKQEEQASHSELRSQEQSFEDLEKAYALLDPICEIEHNGEPEVESQEELNQTNYKREERLWDYGTSLEETPLEEEASLEESESSSSANQLDTLSRETDPPLSPFMNPEYFDARSKHRLPKCPPSKTPTPFQRQLSKNPYALALATPIRRCELTKATLPTFFLQQFNLMAHPQTSEPWWVPGNLITKYRGTENTVIEEENSNGSSVQTKEPADNNPEDTEEFSDSETAFQASEVGSTTTDPTSLPAVDPLHVPQPANQPTWLGIDNRRIGPTTWQLARQDLIHAVTTGSGFGQMPWKSFSKILQQIPAARKTLNAANWRSDMDSFILELMRRRVREALEDLTSLKRGYVVGCSTWEQALMPKRQAAVILWTGTEIKDVIVDGEGERIHGPPEFATLNINPSDFKPHDGQHRRSKILVHNLRILLGRAHMQKLRMACPVYEKEFVILKDKRRVVDVLLKLWKLQGYLAGYEEFCNVGDVKCILSNQLARAHASNPKGFQSNPSKEKKGEPGIRRVNLQLNGIDISG
jgi:hypothetical protein